MLVHADEDAVPIIDLEDDEAELAFFAAQAAEAMHGVRRVERLAGNVGVLELAPALFPATLAGDTISAATRILASTDALLLDPSQASRRRPRHGGAGLLVPAR